MNGQEDVTDSLVRGFLGKLPPDVIEQLLTRRECADFPAGSVWPHTYTQDFRERRRSARWLARASGVPSRRRPSRLGPTWWASTATGLERPSSSPPLSWKGG